MRVLVTGGTGYVGARIVADAVRAGHDVRMLVRRPEQVHVSLTPYDVGVDDVVVGDVLDEDAVRRAVRGCDAVVHAAAVFALDAKRGKEVQQTNAEAARAGGLSRAVRRRARPRHPHLEHRRADPLRRQRSGAGPYDPYRGVNSELLRWALRGLFPLFPAGSTHAVDVRTVAATVLALLEPGRGPRRYVVPGEALDAGLMYGTLERVTGRRLPHVVVPGPLGVPLARVMSLLQRPLPTRWHYPADVEGAELAVRDTRFDDTPARRDLGVVPVPFEQSLRDTTRWLVESGRLPARYAARALSAQS